MNGGMGSSLLIGDSSVYSLVYVFNYPFGFNYLAQIKEIDSFAWVVKSEVVFVITKPKPITPQKEIDCGEVISPDIEKVEGLKYWAEVHLHKTWREVASNIVKTQERQLCSYQYGLELLKDNPTYANEKMKSLSNLVYDILEDKINRTKRAISLINHVITDSAQ